MKASEAGKSLIFLGITLGIIGFGLSLIEETRDFGAFGYYYPITIHPYLFIGAALIGVGINWFIGGLLLNSVSKDIANDGILLAIFFGALGVLFWLILSHPNKVSTVSVYSEEAHGHCPSCNNVIPFYSVQYCPHCGQKLDQAKPDYVISEVK
jgi:hypothetical protein